MPTIEKNNKALNTTVDFSVQIEDQSPLTKFDDIQGGKAIGISIPVNDVNRQILNNPDRFEKLGQKDDRKFTGYSIRHNGQVLMEGTLIIDETTKSEYSGWLRDLVGNLAERVKGKYINQTALGGEKTFVAKTDYDPATDDYCCPKIFNRHFWRDRGKTVKTPKTVIDMEGTEFSKNEDIGNLTLQHLENEEYFVNYRDITGLVTGGLDKAPVVSPFLFLWKTVELILKDNGIFVAENFLKNDPELIRLCMYHTFNIAVQEMYTTSYTQFAHDYWGDMTQEQETFKITGMTWATDKFQYKDLLPKMGLGNFILAIQNKLNVVFDFNGIDEVRIIDREAVLISEAYDIDEYAIGEWEPGDRKDVTIKLSDEKDSNDAAFSDNWQDLSDIRDYIGEPVIQRTDLPLTAELDEIRLVTGEERYYQYHWYTPEAENADGTMQQEDILDWEAISLRFQPYFYNDGDRDNEEISSKLGTLRQSANGYPIVQQQGNCAAFRTRFTSFSPRLFFYLDGDAAAHQTAALSLDYDGDNGIAAKRFRYTLPFMANALTVKRTFKLPASIYHYVRSQKAAMAFRTREGSFVIDKMTATANRAQLIRCEIEAYKREDNFWNFTTGTTPGSGGITPPSFIAKFVGVTANGKPFLITSSGAVKSPPAWGALSSAAYSGQRCIDYAPADKLLFVGGYGGMLDIYDLSDPTSLRKKSIRIMTTQISCVRVANGHILMGTNDDVRYVYTQPYYSTLDEYTDLEATTNAGHKPYTGIPNDFCFADGYYYGCTQNGEVFRGTDLVNWTEILDLDAAFTRMTVTETRIWVWDNNDRNCYAERADPTHWHEFDLTSGTGPNCIEAVAVAGDKALCIVLEKSGQQRALNMFDPNVPGTEATPSLALICAGAAVVSNESVISISGELQAKRIATWHVPQATWSYINVPELFQKLFGY